MIPLPLARIAEITSGALSGMADPRAVVRGPVVIDSRAVEPGSLFVAIKGARVDGHDYAAQAVRAGAVAVLAGRPVDAPAVIVPDAAAALAELAAAQVRTLPKVTVIGVTGSAGKTSTKDLLAKLTGRIGSTIAPVGSFNNELGHPLTVLRADLETRFMVLELAARNIGHIKDLTRIAPPQIGVVLNVGTAHLGVFGGKEAIAKAKGELVEALPRTGVAVLNADDPLVRGMASRTEARVTYFGCGESAAIRAEGVVIDNRGRASFTLRTPSGAAHVSLKLYGAHAVSNALAAAAAGYELGLPVATIAEELSEATPRSRWRMEVTDRADGVTVVNDAYNANPDSMKAAFEAFATLGKGRRRFAVIAALRELGDEGPALNAELGRLAGGAGLAGLIVAGPDAGPVLDGAHEAAQATAQELAAHTTFPQGAPGPMGAGPTGAGPGGAVPGVVAPAWPSVPGAVISGPQTPAGPAQTPPGPLSGPHGPAPQDRQPTGPEQGPPQSWYGPDAEHGAPQGWHGPEAGGGQPQGWHGSDAGVPQPAPGPGWQVPDEGAVPPGQGWHGQAAEHGAPQPGGPVPDAGGPRGGHGPEAGGARSPDWYGPEAGSARPPGWHGPEAGGGQPQGWHGPEAGGGQPQGWHGPEAGGGQPQGWHGSDAGVPQPAPGPGWQVPDEGAVPPGPGWHGQEDDGSGQGWQGPPTAGGPLIGGMPGGTPVSGPPGAPGGSQAGGPPPGLPSGMPSGPPPGTPPGMPPVGPPVGGPAAGPGGGAYYGQPTRIVHVPDAEAAAAELGSWLRPGDAVLIKGPRAMGLERTAEIILGGSPPVTNIIIAGAVGLILSMLGTPLAIRLFSRRGYGQEIREEGVQAHLGKRGTPTMGGIVFVLASLLAYGASHLAMLEPPTVSGGLVLFLMTGLGAVGFLDDFIKIYKQRSLGLRSGAKALGQLIVGAVFAVLVTRQPNVYGITPAETRLSFLRDFGPPSIGIVGFTIWVLIMIVGFSNAVNLTDGLDGLASGATGVVLAAYVLIGNWQLRNNCIDQLGPNCYWVRDPLDLAVVAAAVLGALIGFLWWNAPPARIFMGDTGSLALGGVLAGLAIATRTQLLLIILAGLCVMITLSVIIQVGFFKMTGKRVFRMAPLQHHFELKGWAETTIVVRFWLIAMLCAALGLGLFYVEWMPR